MHVKRSRISSFEIRSLALFASMAMGSGLASAQFTVGPSAPPKPASTAAPTQEPIRANTWSATEITAAFRKTDADGNGSISRKEAGQSSGLTRNFDKVDSNSDGVVSRSEFDQSLK